MSDMVQLPTVVENGGYGGFGGMGLGTGFIGGLVLGSIWNGGFGGWGNNRNGQIGADVMLQNGIQNLNNQVQNGVVSQLQSAAGITAAVNQNTLSTLQGDAGIAQQVCNLTGRLSQEIDTTGDQAVAAINATNIQSMNNTAMLGEKLCGINNNITSQGYENRLQAQSLAAQLQQQHAALSAQIAQENCADRELMREIASQNVRDKLAEEQAKNAALTAQINLSNQLQAQTLYLINQLKPATATATATTSA